MIVIVIMIMIVIKIVMLICIDNELIMTLPLIYLGHPFAKARYLSDSVNEGIFEVFFLEILLLNFFNNKKSGFI